MISETVAAKVIHEIDSVVNNPLTVSPGQQKVIWQKIIELLMEKYRERFREEFPLGEKTL